MNESLLNQSINNSLVKEENQLKWDDVLEKRINAIIKKYTK